MINDLIRDALTIPLDQVRVAYVAPYYRQAKAVAWDYAKEYTAPIPGRVVNESELRIDFPNGARFRLFGADNYDTLRGLYFDSVALDEPADFPADAWKSVIRPALSDRRGKATWMGTPKGKNLFYERWLQAQGDPEWFTMMARASETGILSQSELDAALRDMGEDRYLQEYECSFDIAIIGAYWGRELHKVTTEGRLQPFDIDPDVPVHTAWDLGKAANNPVWCFQVIAGRPVIVDFYEPDSEDIKDWVGWLDERGYKGNDYVPHDIMATEWGSGRTRFEILQGLGRRPIRVPRVSFADGVQAGRETINQALWRDTPRVQLGLEILKTFHREWDEDLKAFRDLPVKNRGEHAASAMRYLGLAWRNIVPAKPKAQAPTELIYEVQPDGRIVGNMSVADIVRAKERARKHG